MTPLPTVFIVDDDPAVLKSLARLLRSAQINAQAFSSPQEFLEKHDPAAPGCLVLDLAMPGLNGLELQAALTANGHALPIIFLTGHGDIPTSVQAMKRGAVDFITKPVNTTIQQLVKIGKMPIALQAGYRYYAEGPSGGVVVVRQSAVTG